MKLKAVSAFLTFIWSGLGGSFVLCAGSDGHRSIEPAFAACCARVAAPEGGSAIAFSGGCGGCEDVALSALLTSTVVSKPVWSQAPLALPTHVLAFLAGYQRGIAGSNFSPTTSPTSPQHPLSHLKTVVLLL